MDSRISRLGLLARTLPASRFSEWHGTIMRAQPEAIWRTLLAMRWSDLRAARPLLLARGFASSIGEGCLSTFAAVGAATSEHPPHNFTLGFISQPWRPSMPVTPAADFQALREFNAPGWVKIGMEWRLTSLDDARTHVETSTLCEATDAAARRRFAAYWTVIRGPSGLIRRDMLATIRRLTRQAPA